MNWMNLQIKCLKILDEKLKEEIITAIGRILDLEQQILNLKTKE